MYSTTAALKNISWLFGERSVTMAISLAVNLVLARNLGPDLFGEISYLLSFLSLLVPFSALGLNALVTRELVEKPSKVGSIIGTALTLRFSGSILAILLVAVGMMLPITTMLPKSWLLIAALANSMTAFLLFDFYFQSKVASRYVVRIRVSVLVVSSLLKLLAVWYGASIEMFFTLMLLEPVATGIMLFWSYRRYSSKQNPHQVRFEPLYAKELLTQSRWLILSGFMAVVYLKIDQLMLGQISGANEVGIYAVAVRLSEVWYFFPQAIVASFFPKLLKSRSNSEEYALQLRQLCNGLFTMALFLALAITLIAKPAVLLLFGSSYEESAEILKVHIWAGCFIFMRALLSKWLIAEGLLKFSLFTHGVAAIINVILNLILIPDYGGYGAAIATLVAYATSSYFILWAHPKTKPMAKIMTRAMLGPLNYKVKKLS